MISLGTKKQTRITLLPNNMETRATTSEFETQKCSFLLIAIMGLVYLLAAIIFIIVAIREREVSLTIFILRLLCAIELLYCATRALIALYKVSFFPDCVQLDYYLFFFKKRVIIKYTDLKYVVCIPKYKLLSFCKKGLFRMDLSTSLNKYWKKEQIKQMAELLSEHNVTIKPAPWICN